MAKGGNQPANKNAEVKRMMEAGEKGNERGEEKLGTVDEESEGSESAANTGEPNENDFAEPNEGSEDSQDQVEAGDKAPSSPDKDEEDSATAYPVVYDYKDDDDKGEPIGCTMDNFQVCEMGREHYGLVGPTAQTGATLVCAMVDLVPGNADQFGIAPAWILKRKHVLVMGRGKDMHFIYATMDSAMYEGDGQTEITT